MSILDLKRIYEQQRQFANERDWAQFHTPKNLSMALTVEASELMEIFQWMSDEEVKKVDSDAKTMAAVSDELADILFYTLRLASILKIDLESAYKNKMKKNAEKYPIHLSKGNAKKYTEL